MRGAVKALIVTAVIIAILAAVGLSLYSEYSAFSSLKVTDSGVENVEVKGINPLVMDFIPDYVSGTYYLDINNPSGTDAVIDRLHYVITVEGHYAGEGDARNIEVPAGMTQRVRIPFTISVSNALSAIGDALKRGDNVIDYTIKGYAEVPIMILGFKVTDVRVSFEQPGIMELPSIPGITKPKAAFISTRWTVSEGQVGKLATAILGIKGPFDDCLKIQVKKDIILGTDKVVKEQEICISIPAGQTKYIKIEFTPDEPTKWNLRGYYILVIWNGAEIYRSNNLKVG